MMRRELEETARHNKADERIKKGAAIANAISGLTGAATQALMGKAGIVGNVINAVGKGGSRR